MVAIVVKTGEVINVKPVLKGIENGHKKYCYESGWTIYEESDLSFVPKTSMVEDIFQCADLETKHPELFKTLNKCLYDLAALGVNSYNNAVATITFKQQESE